MSDSQAELKSVHAGHSKMIKTDLKNENSKLWLSQLIEGGGNIKNKDVSNLCWCFANLLSLMGKGVQGLGLLHYLYSNTSVIFDDCFLDCEHDMTSGGTSSFYCFVIILSDC